MVNQTNKGAVSLKIREWTRRAMVNQTNTGSVSLKRRQRTISNRTNTESVSLKGRERSIVNQTNTGSVSIAVLTTLLKVGLSAYGLSQACRRRLELNETELTLVNAQPR